MSYVPGSSCVTRFADGVAQDDREARPDRPEQLGVLAAGASWREECRRGAQEDETDSGGDSSAHDHHYDVGANSDWPRRAEVVDSRPMALGRNAKIDLIKSVPLFSRCSKKELAEVAKLADEIDFGPGKELIREGALGREFFVLVEGSVDVRRKGQEGQLSSARATSSGRSPSSHTRRGRRR